MLKSKIHAQFWFSELVGFILKNAIYIAWRSHVLLAYQSLGGVKVLVKLVLSTYI
jgi:hypothetical protein